MKSHVRIDRRAVMLDAHRRYRDGVRLKLGWTFAQCLTTAWAAAKIRAANPPERYAPATPAPAHVAAWAGRRAHAQRANADRIL